MFEELQGGQCDWDNVNEGGQQKETRSGRGESEPVGRGKHVGLSSEKDGGGLLEIFEQRTGSDIVYFIKGSLWPFC